jgi:glycolate oxidase FAD binding subunit
MTIFTPQNSEQLQKIAKEQSALIIRSGGSKPALSFPPENANLLDMSQLRGIIEYQADEYTFTAYADTALSEINMALAEHGQYLPFEPILVEQGATLGGTVAANTSGSGRFRYGGVRDFILGIRFVDGYGNLVRSGGKVVKNAAGFDLSKFMVGSLGHYGALVELSFKVFPKPQVYQTLALTYPDTRTALQAIFALSSSTLEMDALDLEVNEEAFIPVQRLETHRVISGKCFAI